jgi:biopolymer transport protein ExbB
MKHIKFSNSIWIAILPGVLSETAWAGDGGSPMAVTNYFYKFFIAGGWLVWLILLPLSIVTVSLIIQNFLVIRRNRLIPPDLLAETRNFNYQSKINSVSADSGSGDSMLGRILGAVRQASPGGEEAMENAARDSLEQETTSILRKIEWLHIIGNVAPMIGLFGTVWGMIDAFNAIVQAGGQPTLGHLAGGISIVLVSTWWGLVSAIPALAAFGILRNRIETIASDIASHLDRYVLRAAAEVKL